MTTSTIVSLLAGNTAVALAIALVAWGAGRAGRPALAHAAWLLVLVKLLTPPLWQVRNGCGERCSAGSGRY